MMMKYSSFNRLKFEGEWVQRPCSREDRVLVGNTKSAPSLTGSRLPEVLHVFEVVGVALVVMASEVHSPSSAELSLCVATPTIPYQNLP